MKIFGFDEKIRFLILAGKWKNLVLTGNQKLSFWWKNKNFDFCGKWDFFFCFGGKMRFHFFRKNEIFYSFGGKMHFCSFGGKYIFVVFLENVFLSFWRKICIFGGKCFFCFFMILTGKYSFGGKVYITVLSRKYVFEVLRKNAFMWF